MYLHWLLFERAFSMLYDDTLHLWFYSDLCLSKKNFWNLKLNISNFPSPYVGLIKNLPKLYIKEMTDIYINIATTGKCPNEFTQYFKKPTIARKTKGSNIESLANNLYVHSEKNIGSIEKS